jgi:hypothetical protein
MSCDRESLFTNRTLCPTETVTCGGLTLPFEIVIVAPIAPTDPVELTTGPDGEFGEPEPPSLPPPQAMTVASAAAVANCPIHICHRLFTTSPEDQKNFREMLKPMNRSSLVMPPTAN